MIETRKMTKELDEDGKVLIWNLLRDKIEHEENCYMSQSQRDKITELKNLQRKFL